MTQFECKSYSGYLPNNELLSFIRSHADTYIFSLWTSNTERVISDFIQKEGLRPIFQNIISLNTVHYSKPYPDGFYKIYNASFSKKDYLMIGDSDNDESAAKAAGIDFFKVDYFDRQ
jgi:HAD superfamily hydrolase (TIGR01549 family)